MKITKLKRMNTCEKAIQYFKSQRTIALAWQNCKRGDWMLLFAIMLKVNERLLILTKGKIAEIIIHLMKDQRSKIAVLAAIAFGKGEITREELNDAAHAAFDAAHVKYVNAIDSYAAYAAVYATDAFPYVTYATPTSIEIWSMSLMFSSKKSADICREYLTDEVLIKYKKLK